MKYTAIHEKTGEKQTFSSINNLMTALNIKKPYLLKCLRGQQATCNGWVIIRGGGTDDGDDEDEEEEAEKFTRRSKSALFYAYNKDLEKEYTFTNKNIAETTTGVAIQTIRKSLTNPPVQSKSWMFSYNPIMERKQQPTSAIVVNGVYFFDSISEASDYTQISRAAIYEAMQKGGRPIKGWKFQSTCKAGSSIYLLTHKKDNQVRSSQSISVLSNFSGLSIPEIDALINGASHDEWTLEIFTKS